MRPIPMIDIQAQNALIRSELDEAIRQQIDRGDFIQGNAVGQLEDALGKRFNIDHVIGCASGTDALQLGLMAFDLEMGSEVIVPSFTYSATVEVIILLGLVPVFIDVDPSDFTMNAGQIESLITPRTRAIIPVHLFGQGANMKSIMQIAQKHDLYVLEDNAQAIDAKYHYSDGSSTYLGGIGHIATTSFFPTKNLGCFGDGGAIFTNDDMLADRLRSMANHGQSNKYFHRYIGVNSRLDSLQAAILMVKLSQLDRYNESKSAMAARYDSGLSGIDDLAVPAKRSDTQHVYHQYTLKVKNGRRDALREYLRQEQIASTIYYPLPGHRQEAYSAFYRGNDLSISEQLCNEVLSIPIYTEMNSSDQDRVIHTIQQYFK